MASPPFGELPRGLLRAGVTGSRAGLHDQLPTLLREGGLIAYIGLTALLLRESPGAFRGCLPPVPPDTP